MSFRMFCNPNIKGGMRLDKIELVFDFSKEFEKEYLEAPILAKNNLRVFFKKDDWKHILFGGGASKIKNPKLDNKWRAKCFYWSKEIIEQTDLKNWRIDSSDGKHCLLYFNGPDFPHYLVVLRFNIKRQNYQFVTGYPMNEQMALRIFNCEDGFKSFVP